MSIEEKFLFVLILSPIPISLFGSMIFSFFDLTYKRGIDGIVREICKYIILGILHSWWFFVIFMIYPNLSDYWKLIGSGILILVPTFFITVFAFIPLSEKTFEDRKKCLEKFGWTRVRRSDYDKREDEWLKEYQMKHPVFGLMDVSKAEKVTKKNIIK